MGPALPFLAIAATVASTVVSMKAASAQQAAQQAALGYQARANIQQNEMQVEELGLQRERYEEQSRQLQLQADQAEQHRRYQLASDLSTAHALAAARGTAFEPGSSADAFEREISRLAEEDIGTEKLNVLTRKNQALQGAVDAGRRIGYVQRNMDLALPAIAEQSRLSSEAFGAAQTASAFAGVSKAAQIGYSDAGQDAIFGKVDPATGKRPGFFARVNSYWN